MSTATFPVVHASFKVNFDANNYLMYIERGRVI